jgi:hypothetical protein
MAQTHCPDGDCVWRKPVRLRIRSQIGVKSLQYILIFHGTDQVAICRCAAFYVDKNLGERNLPTSEEGPTKFELLINLKTAKALGLDVRSWYERRSKLI